MGQSGDDHSVTHLAAHVLRRACAARVTIAVAESCTGGLLATLVTGQEGVSHAFDRGFVVYTDESKQELLGVPEETIAREGAVSEVCAREMATGALANSRSAIAVAITGFAGPSTGNEPAGLVHIAVATAKGEVLHRRFVFAEDERPRVRLHAAREALVLVEAGLDRLASGPSDHSHPRRSPW